MKKLMLILILLVTSLNYGQKKYSFDYLFLYKEICKNHSKPVDYVYLVNSKNNNFNLISYENAKGDDIENYDLNFNDYSGKRVHTKTSRAAFYKAETITTECSNYHSVDKMKKTFYKNYFFENLNDTTINDTTFYHYVLKNNKKEKYKKKTNIGKTHFIVYKNSSEILPILNTLEYFVWQRDKNIPNGYLKMRYHIDYNGAKTNRIELVKSIKTNKEFIIPKECDTAGIVVDLKNIQKR